MLCYKDTTFCPFHEDCTLGDVCSRALTQEVREGADKWWVWFNDDEDAIGAPIAEYTSKPGCHVTKRN